MSDTKHTPGPWTCDVTDQGGAGHNAYVAVVASESRQVIARVVCYNSRLDPIPYQANARLIVASEEMLEALKIAREAIIENWPQQTDLDTVYLADARLAQIESAIAAAESLKAGGGT